MLGPKSLGLHVCIGYTPLTMKSYHWVIIIHTACQTTRLPLKKCSTLTRRQTSKTGKQEDRKTVCFHADDSQKWTWLTDGSKAQEVYIESSSQIFDSGNAHRTNHIANSTVSPSMYRQSLLRHMPYFCSTSDVFLGAQKPPVCQQRLQMLVNILTSARGIARPFPTNNTSLVDSQTAPGNHATSGLQPEGVARMGERYRQVRRVEYQNILKHTSCCARDHYLFHYPVQDKEIFMPSIHVSSWSAAENLLI